MDTVGQSVGWLLWVVGYLGWKMRHAAPALPQHARHYGCVQSMLKSTPLVQMPGAPGLQEAAQGLQEAEPYLVAAQTRVCVGRTMSVASSALPCCCFCGTRSRAPSSYREMQAFKHAAPIMQACKHATHIMQARTNVRQGGTVPDSGCAHVGDHRPVALQRLCKLVAKVAGVEHQHVLPRLNLWCENEGYECKMMTMQKVSCVTHISRGQLLPGIVVSAYGGLTSQHKVAACLST